MTTPRNSSQKIIKCLRITWITILGFGILITASILLLSNHDFNGTMTVKLNIIDQSELGLAVGGILVVFLGFYYGINKIFDEPEGVVSQ